MDTILNYLEKIKELLTWQVVIIILALSFRYQIKELISVLKERMKTADNISIGKDGILINQKLEKLEQTLQGTLNSSTLAAPRGPLSKIRIHGPADDPLKDSWQGSLTDKNRSISAMVEPIPETELYKIVLKVYSNSPKQDPLIGKVKFYLHPSFPNNEPEVDTQEGVAILPLISYGSFTVGAETTDGARLKIDLAKDVPGVSDHFKNS